ncbi:hypothetical protein [Mycobacterium riyadhense]|uniref:hypothetical protein n=1 Tax=Mycobacterium riyadhense TaxID=486698 RepID=UPI0019512EA4|nr:hypothetical protein [Mycobacterium riyadhense]
MTHDRTGATVYAEGINRSWWAIVLTGRRLTNQPRRYDDRFLAGVILHTGTHLYELGDRITAAPIAALWS